ncbi:iron-sulfur-binding ferredoxin reductase [Stutzerimonas tarimensis]|uniref:Iron-sulfur-binding ferredoxin reductase n=1 Tax=Stutzerimonas tarimensis TaxID=1507735 RepID=A0ABV7T0K4_9GAMM
MPELSCQGRRWTVPQGANLLDALLQAGIEVPYGCRAGSCQSCQVRCVAGVPEDARPEALDAARRAQGWRLACQCRLSGDLEVDDPQQAGTAAGVDDLTWLGGEVLRLRLVPERPLAYRAGQQLVLRLGETARPCSLASLPGEGPWLEFHLACAHAGAFCDGARRLKPGDRLELGALIDGALHYDPTWTDQPLLLLAHGIGLAPLWAVLREALRQGHSGPIRLLQMGAHYLAEPLADLAQVHGTLQVELLEGEELPPGFRMTRRTIALVCGHRAFAEACAKRLFLAGVPRGQVFVEAFADDAGDS